MANNEDFLHQLAQESQQLEVQPNANESHTYIDPNDGTCYEWNQEKSAWFPKITEDFLAAYQASYGVPNATVETKEAAPIIAPPAIKNKKRPRDKPEKKDSKVPKQDSNDKSEQPGWFEVDEKHNTNVYVSNLPTDITEDEFVEFMSKCGIIMKETDSGKLKIKLYTDEEGQLKGDGRCCYMKVESVDLALKILDGYTMRDKEVRVERATFQLKGQYDPTKKPKKKKNKEKQKIAKMQNRLFDWRPERPLGERAKCEKVVIIKNMFDIKEFEEDATLILEYQTDLREECSKFGEVKKVVIYDRHPEGIASVSFKEPEMADECIATLNGRWFAGRQLSAQTYDGKTKYSIQETDAEQQQRREQWETFLEKDEKATTSS